jgi:Malonate decarboxylase, alpha subunit, transporter
MTQQTLGQVSRSWTTRRDEKQRRMQQVQHWMEGPILPRTKMIEALESLIVSGDRVVLEGDNQKQADFLSRSLVQVDAKKVHDLHLIISSLSRPEHLTLFELGIAKKVDFAFAGAQSLRDLRRTLCATAGRSDSQCRSCCAEQADAEESVRIRGTGNGDSGLAILNCLPCPR